MAYIQDLRKFVGHQPIIGVGAAVLITDSRRRLLMGFRTDNHFWGIPGGTMEPGETLEETARREVKEETGLDLGEIALFNVFSGPGLFYTYPNGDQIYNVSIVYQTDQFQGNLVDDGEHSKFQFFARNEITIESVSPPVRPVIEAWLSEANHHD